jgi:hypothetical protein
MLSLIAPKRVLDARPVKTEKLTAKQYLDLTANDRAFIETIRIEPAKLGSKGFGGLVVVYKHPVFKVG